MSDPSSFYKPTVLLVDDDANVLATLRDLVLNFGYETRTATTGVAALAAVKAYPPDAVPLDIAMPGVMDGMKTLQVIKAQWPELPVIMVTANIDVSIGQTTLRDGAFDYVMKPVELGRLREVLTAALTLSGKVPPAIAPKRQALDRTPPIA
jgi:DNA-binding NtrC family response regulator